MTKLRALEAGQTGCALCTHIFYCSDSCTPAALFPPILTQKHLKSTPGRSSYAPYNTGEDALIILGLLRFSEGHNDALRELCEGVVHDCGFLPPRGPTQSHHKTTQLNNPTRAPDSNRYSIGAASSLVHDNSDSYFRGDILFMAAIISSKAGLV